MIGQSSKMNALNVRSVRVHHMQSAPGTRLTKRIVASSRRDKSDLTVRQVEWVNVVKRPPCNLTQTRPVNINFIDMKPGKAILPVTALFPCEK